VFLIPWAGFYYFYILHDLINIKLALVNFISTILTKLEKSLCHFKLNVICIDYIINHINIILINLKEVCFYLEQLVFLKIRNLGELLIAMRNRPAQLGKFLVKWANYGLGTNLESTAKNLQPSMRLAFSDTCFFANADLVHKNSLKERCFDFIRPIINLSSRPLAMRITPGHITTCLPFSARGSRYFPGVEYIPVIIPSLTFEGSVKHFEGNVKYFTTRLTLKDLCKNIKNTPNFNTKYPRIHLHIMEADMIHVTTEDYKVEINKIKRTISINILKHKDKPLCISYSDKSTSLIYNHKPYIKYEDKSLYTFFDYDDKHLNSKLNNQFSKDLFDIGTKYNINYFYNWENKTRELLRLTEPSKKGDLKVFMQTGFSTIQDNFQIGESSTGTREPNYLNSGINRPLEYDNTSHIESTSTESIYPCISIEVQNIQNKDYIIVRFDSKNFSTEGDKYLEQILTRGRKVLFNHYSGLMQDNVEVSRAIENITSDDIILDNVDNLDTPVDSFYYAFLKKYSHIIESNDKLSFSNINPFSKLYVDDSADYSNDYFSDAYPRPAEQLTDFDYNMLEQAGPSTEQLYTGGQLTDFDYNMLEQAGPSTGQLCTGGQLTDFDYNMLEQAGPSTEQLYTGGQLTDFDYNMLEQAGPSTEQLYTGGQLTDFDYNMLEHAGPSTEQLYTGGQLTDFDYNMLEHAGPSTSTEINTMYHLTEEDSNILINELVRRMQIL
jgi:hypothetical protein